MIFSLPVFSNMKLNRTSDVINVFPTQTDVVGLKAIIKGKIISFADKDILDKDDLQGWAKSKNLVTVRLYNKKSLKVGDILYIANKN